MRNHTQFPGRVMTPVWELEEIYGWASPQKYLTFATTLYLPHRDTHTHTLLLPVGANCSDLNVCQFSHSANTKSRLAAEHGLSVSAPGVNTVGASNVIT